MDEDPKHRFEYRHRPGRARPGKWEYWVAGVIWLAIAAMLAWPVLAWLFGPDDPAFWDM